MVLARYLKHGMRFTCWLLCQYNNSVHAQVCNRFHTIILRIQLYIVQHLEMQCSKVAANFLSYCQPQEHYKLFGCSSSCKLYLVAYPSKQHGHELLAACKERRLMTWPDLTCIRKDDCTSAWSIWIWNDGALEWNIAGAWSIGQAQSNTSLGPKKCPIRISIDRLWEGSSNNHLVLSDPSIQNSGCRSCMRTQ